jgi:hypothetical protein
MVLMRILPGLMLTTLAGTACDAVPRRRLPKEYRPLTSVQP